MARPRSFDEQEVLTAARAQFRMRGYAGTSLDDISDATGLGKGSLYGAFGSKRELFLRVFDGYCADADAALERLTAGPDSGALERLSTFLIANAVNSANDESGCLIARSTAELGRRDREVSGRAEGAFTSIRLGLAQTIMAAQRALDIGAEVEPHAAAGVLLSVLRGTEALSRAGVSESELVQIATDALAATTGSRQAFAAQPPV